MQLQAARAEILGHLQLRFVAGRRECWCDRKGDRNAPE
jgi:hypothetical protein